MKGKFEFISLAIGAVLFAIVLLAAACGPTAPTEVEVTRVVEQEVTRIVEVEITRLVERPIVVTATPRPTMVPRATSTPRNTPTPRATAVPEVGTLANPVPLGETAELVMGGALEFTMAITRTMRGAEAWSFIQQANRFNDPAPAGFEFVVALVEVAYTGPDQGILELSKYNMSSVTNNQILGYWDMDNTPCCMEPEFDFQILPGGSASGWLGLYVAVGDPAPLFMLGDIYFSVTPPAG